MFEKFSDKEFKVQGEKYTIKDIKVAPSVKFRNWIDIFTGGYLDEEETEEFNKKGE